METMYQKYAEEYDLNSDREEVLKKMCKTSLKMDEALDTEDITDYKNLATVFDQLRKSGRFTEAQKKEEKRELLSTIGELAALCEKNGGIIEALPQFDPNQYPQDVIDFVGPDFMFAWSAPKKDYSLPTDSIAINNDEITCAWALRIITVFHITSEQQLKDIRYYNYENMMQQRLEEIPYKP